jgi:YHS domain-containing protein
MWLRFIIGMIAIYVIYRLSKRLLMSLGSKERIQTGANRPGNVGRIGEELVEDPYCHTYVPITNAVEATENGKKIFFCSQDCMKAYLKARS